MCVQAPLYGRVSTHRRSGVVLEVGGAPFFRAGVIHADGGSLDLDDSLRNHHRVAQQLRDPRTDLDLVRDQRSQLRGAVWRGAAWSVIEHMPTT